MKVGFYAGSFDPFTNGHLHVVKTASTLFDIVIIGIGIDSKKARRFDKDKMKKAIELTLQKEHLDNVSVISYDNLSVDVALAHHTTFLIRGIRNGMDYDYEENMALINQEVSGLDTIYIRSGRLGALSSSLVMELLKNGKDVTNYLPEDIISLV